MFLRKMCLFILVAVITQQAAYGSQSKSNSNHQWEFAIAVIFRDEAKYLKEWIEFHKLVGAQHFYMINHLSSDNYLEVLDPYIKKREVELINISQETTNEYDFTRMQTEAYNRCLELARGNVTWLAFLDTDEFLFTRDGTKIQDFLRFILNNSEMRKNIGGCLAPWTMFGTSNVDRIPSDKTLIETLVQCSETPLKVGKTICRPDCVKEVSNPHYCEYKSHMSCANNFTRFQKNIQLNHYWTRDEDFFWNRKIARKQQWGKSPESTIKQAEVMNQKTDTAILRYVPALRASLDLPVETNQ